MTPLFHQVGRVAEGVVTHRTAPFTGYAFGRSRRGNDVRPPHSHPKVAMLARLSRLISFIFILALA